MTKDNNMSPLNMEMNTNKVSRPNRMWQGPDEVDLIAPCKEKLQQLFSCCQDVAHIVETLEAHMQSDRPREAPATLEVDNTKIEICLLRDELRRSKLRNEELEVAKMSMEKKIAGMEEKIQALTAQLMVYKEDFDLERLDRERAQGRLNEFEQQLLFYQRPANAQSSYSHQPHHHHHCLSDELVPRGGGGRDVCDFIECDGVAEDDRIIGEKPTLPYTVMEIARQKDFTVNHDCCSPLEQFKAQSFNIFDFFPATADAEKCTDVPASRVVGRDALAEDGWSATERDTLCADGVELPSTHCGFVSRGQSISSPPSKRPALQYKPQDDDLYHPRSWSFLPEDQAETTLGNLNLYQTDSPCHLPETSAEDSLLMCPKCRLRFSCSDHHLLLDHLEEC